ncbi:MAG TPA: DUF2243 domain-containing protein [Azospirillaceae bacterium]|nr:DUF2243 domain-containing protein [Azospirillaceae bacterium]
MDKGTGPLKWAGGLIGFALGGFFDGILLHQILQWHHLLSGIDRAPFGDLQVQILADGLFHAAMYVVALAGLGLLWRARRTAVASGGALAGWALAGFGAWHVVDGVLFHWVLGLHHIRMDPGAVAFWDGVFLTLGVVTLAGGLMIARRHGPKGGGGRFVAAGIAGLVVLSGPVAALPPPGATAIALIVPDGAEAEAMRAVAAADGTLVRADPGVWVVDLGPDGRVDALGDGARVVGRRRVPIGCFARRV